MRIKYTEKLIKELLKNPCVFNCTTKGISYTYEFKLSAIKLHTDGVRAIEIWKRAGFNTSIWNSDYFRTIIRDWKVLVSQYGNAGLLRTDGVQSDKGPTTSELDKLRRLELKVKYLEQENSFLAKLRARNME